MVRGMLYLEVELGKRHEKMDCGDIFGERNL